MEAMNKGVLVDVSSFSTNFPKHRGIKLLDAWLMIESVLLEFGIFCALNLENRSLTVSTTDDTTDPYVIIKARDLIKLLSSGIPASQAIRVLDDEIQCDIINVRNLVPGKGIEAITECRIFVLNVIALGTYEGLELARRLVEDCMMKRMRSSMEEFMRKKSGGGNQLFALKI